MNALSLSETELLAEVARLRTRNAALEDALAAATTAQLEAERSCADARVKHETERLACADTISRINAELARARQVKEAFLPMISHELRTLLAVILGNSEGLIDGIYSPLTPQQRLPLERIDAAARHLPATIGDMLDVTFLAADKVELELAPAARPRESGVSRSVPHSGVFNL